MTIWIRAPKTVVAIALSLLTIGCNSSGTPVVIGDAGATADGAQLSGDDEPSGSKFSSNPTDDRKRCTVEIWRGPETSIEPYSCVPTIFREGDGPVAQWRCSCNRGPTTMSTAETCEEAVADACGVTRPERMWCDTKAGTCWPIATGPDVFRCRCRDTMELKENVTADSCNLALYDNCATSCSDLQDTCEPVSGAAGRFSCRCGNYFDGSRTREVPAETCDQAIEACRAPGSVSEGIPGVGIVLAGCQALTGYCDRGEDAWNCVCIDGSEGRVTFAEIGQFCWEAAQKVCAGVPAPRDQYCEDTRQSGGVPAKGQCHRFWRDGKLTYDCECSRSDGRRSDPPLQDTPTCAEALAVCFAGLEQAPPAIPDAGQ